jgi:hypothetical protein
MKPVVTSVSLLAFVLLSAPAGSATRAFDGSLIASSSGPPFEATLPAIQANVFTPSCALSFCHGAALQAGLDLREGASFASLVNVMSVEVPSLLRVEPFAPDDSYLICKLEACGVMVGQQMPLIGGPLDQSVIDVIRQWIMNGAEEEPIPVDATHWGRIKSLYRD